MRERHGEGVANHADLESCAGSGDIAGEALTEGEGSADLAKAVAGTIAQGIALFAAQVQVAPGIPIAGFVTSAPGSLI